MGVVTGVLLLASGTISYFVALHYSNEVHDRWLIDSARSLAAQVKYVAQLPALELPEVAVEMFVWDDQDEIYFEVKADGNRRIAGNAHFPEVPPLDPGEPPQFADTTLNGKRVRTVRIAVPSARPAHAIDVIVAETLNKRSFLAREILVATVPVQLLLIALGGIAMWWGLRGGLSVVDAIARAIRERDPLDRRAVPVPAAAPSEIEPLIVALNDLIIRVNQARESQQRFVANAAHQLRTPVATLQIQIERAMRERDPREQAVALAHVETAVRRLGHLLHQLLMLAKVEPGAKERLQFVPCNLADVAHDVLERFVDRSVQASVDLGLAAPERPVTVMAERTLVAELLVNLVDNSLLYGRPGGRVTVGVVDVPPTLYVEDNGPGIPPHDREHAGDRFFRGAGAGGSGCGLGLAIVREIADLHGASVTIEDPDGGGTRVSVRFKGPEDEAFRESDAVAVRQ